MSQQFGVKVTRVGEHAIALPARATPSAAGLDLRAAKRWTLYPGEQAVIPTGFAWSIPAGCVGLIRDRSGLAVRSRITTVAGVIDSDYRGEVSVVLRNDGTDGFVVMVGDRIAQMVVVPCAAGSVEECAELDETVRGDGGFGSTGVA